jgi:hypothetical protein
MAKRLLTSSALAREGGPVHKNSIANLVKRGVLVPVAKLSDGTQIFDETHVSIVRAYAERIRSRKPR